MYICIGYVTPKRLGGLGILLQGLNFFSSSAVLIWNGFFVVAKIGSTLSISLRASIYQNPKTNTIGILKFLILTEFIDKSWDVPFYDTFPIYYNLLPGKLSQIKFSLWHLSIHHLVSKSLQSATWIFHFPPVPSENKSLRYFLSSHRSSGQLFIMI